MKRCAYIEVPIPTPKWPVTLQKDSDRGEYTSKYPPLVSEITLISWLQGGMSVQVRIKCFCSKLLDMVSPWLWPLANS
jgi:hypothetical protein